MNANVFRNLSYGLYIISTLDNERKTGCIANSVMQITSSPATVALSINHDNFTNSCITESGMFAVSILSETSDPSLIGHFGFQSGRCVNKFDNIDHEIKNRLPIVTDSCGYIVCKVTKKMETSTHTVFLGEIIDGDILESSTPMTYAYYHKVIKGKSPKNAPTYLPEEDTAPVDQPKWICSVCGYVYDGDTPFTKLPDTYICPICKQGKDQFRKQS